MKKRKLLAYFFLTFSMIAWGTFYVVCKYVLNFVTPMTVIFFRYLLALIVLFAILIKKKPQHIEKGDFKYILLFGVLGYCISIVLQLYSTALMSSGLSSLLCSINPIVAVVLAVPFLKTKLTLPKIVAVIVAIIGVYIIIGGVGEGGAILGVILAISSVIAWTLASFIIQKKLYKYDVLTITTYAMFCGFIVIIPFSAYDFATSTNIDLLNPTVIIGLIFIGIICTALTNLLWNKSLTMIDADQCSIFCPLQPMIAAIFGCIFLNETITMSFFIGAILIIGGIVLCVMSDNIKLKIDKKNFLVHNKRIPKIKHS